MTIPDRIRLPDSEAVPGRKLYKCLHDKCDRQAESRGLCRSHHVFASKLIKAGKTTWERLEELGKTLPRGYKRYADSEEWFLGKEAVSGEAG